jgi:hypothetical protein
LGKEEKMTRENIGTGMSQSADSSLLNQLHSRYAFSVYGMTDIESILRVSRSDYRIGLGRLALAGVDGSIVKNPDGGHVFFDVVRRITVGQGEDTRLPGRIDSDPGGSHGAVRIDADGSIRAFGTVGVQYTVVQNSEIVRDALDIVENSEEEAVLVYAGNYRGGRVFFVGIGFEPLVVNVGSFRETFHRHLVIYSGHDGNLAHHCASRFDDADLPGVIHWDSSSRRHFSGVKDRVSEAMKNLKRMKVLSDQLAQDVTLMAGIQLPPESSTTSSLIDFCASKIFSTGTASDSVLNYRRRRLKEIYMDSTFSGRRGYNGWALYRAYVALDEETRNSGEDDGALKLMQKTNYGRLRIEVRHRILNQGDH